MQSIKPPFEKRAPNASEERFVQPIWLSEVTSARQRESIDVARANFQQTTPRCETIEDLWQYAYRG